MKSKKSSDFALTAVPRLAEGVLFRKSTEGIVVVMHLDDQGYFFQIDAIAADIWHQINGQRSLAEILRRVAKGLKIEPALLEARARSFMNDLLREKLIKSS